MMEKTKPAFPRPASRAPSGHVGGGQDGMTLREYYAGQALTGFLSNPQCDYQASELARWVLRYADALLEELAKANQEGR